MNGESITRFCLLSDVCGYANDGLLLRILEPAEVAHILKLAKALWTYQGDPCKEKPHALLASGNHSNGFVNVGGVIKEHASIRALFAHSLALSAVRFAPSSALNVCWVVGADTSLTALAGDVARFFNVPHIKMKKLMVDEKSTQIWSPENGEELLELPLFGLQVEELITTSHSALEVRKGIRDKMTGRYPNFSKILPTIVNRSDPRKPVEVIEGSRIVSLLRIPIRNFDPGPETCPYCAAGSEAIKPKDGDNWKRLTA
jgi:hypothetical protein